MTKTYLKMKIKSLAAEARIIRLEERKWWQVDVRRRRHMAADGTNYQIEVTRISYRKRTEDEIAKGHMGQPHPMWWGLRDHRIREVRTEARHSLLAYGFLRDRAYRRIENKAHTRPDWDEVESIALRFSPEDPRIVKQRFTEWKTEAEFDPNAVVPEAEQTNAPT